MQEEKESLILLHFLQIPEFVLLVLLSDVDSQLNIRKIAACFNWIFVLNVSIITLTSSQFKCISNQTTEKICMKVIKNPNENYNL